MSKGKGWIGVDFDGTLAVYDPRDYSKLGAPIKPMVERVKRWLADGWEVRILTARVSGDGTFKRRREALGAKVAIGYWCLEHLGVILEVTCEKDYQMVELWDDRAVTVESNTGKQLGPSRCGLE